jgi:hypothetical protein
MKSFKFFAMGIVAAAAIAAVVAAGCGGKKEEFSYLTVECPTEIAKIASFLTNKIEGQLVDAQRLKPLT